MLGPVTRVREYANPAQESGLEGDGTQFRKSVVALEEAPSTDAARDWEGSSP